GGADERVAAAEVDESNGAPSIGAETTPLGSPVSGEFVGVRQNARLIVAVLVLVPELSSARAIAANPVVDLARRRKAETALVVSCGLAFRLFAGPAAGADQHVDPAEKVNRTLRIGDLTRERASAKTHTFERSAGVIGKHLANCMAKLVAVGDLEENVFDILVLRQCREHRVIRRRLRAIEPQLLRGTLGDIDCDRVWSGVGCQRSLEHERKQIGL